MNRREFTARISRLISQMVSDGNSPIMDYVLRSASEQTRLFNEGKSKCDGVIKLSKHQLGLAMDIYFVLPSAITNGVYVDFGYEKTADLAEKYHKLWEEMGGKPMISWDLCHYEG